MAIFAIRTTVGKESAVADIISNRAKARGLNIKAILVPSDVRGYIFVEAVDRSEVEAAARRLPHVATVLRSEIPLKDIEQYISEKPLVKDVKEGYIVEVISGPFKGERAKVTRVDKSKGEVVIELLEAPVPIPITVRMDAIRVIEKEEEEKE